jgi:hypothetical protein
LKKTKKINLENRTNKKILIFGIITFAAIGSLFIINSFANTTTTTITATYSSSAPCGKRVSNYTYQVPFGNAIWNQPICDKQRHPQSANYAARFYKWSNLNDGSIAGQQSHGKVGVDIGLPIPLLTDPEGLTGNFSRNVYYASNATT